MLEKYGEDSSTHPKVDLEVWEEASGPNKKRQTLRGRSLGISGSTSFAYGIGPFGIPATTEEAIQKVVDKAMTPIVQTQLALVLSAFRLQQKKLSSGSKNYCINRKIITWTIYCSAWNC